MKTTFVGTLFTVLLASCAQQIAVKPQPPTETVSVHAELTENNQSRINSDVLVQLGETASITVENDSAEWEITLLVRRNSIEPVTFKGEAVVRRRGETLFRPTVMVFDGQTASFDFADLALHLTVDSA